METLRQDLKHALKTLAGSLGFAATAIAALTLGIRSSCTSRMSVL